MTDDQFVTAFTGCTTRSQELRHHDHVRMGCLNMSRFPGFGGIGRFFEGLERLAAASRKPRLYHKNDHLGLPVVDPGAFSAILQQSGRQPSWDEFAADNKDLLRGKDYVLKEYYRDETLKISIGEKNIHLAG